MSMWVDLLPIPTRLTRCGLEPPRWANRHAQPADRVWIAFDVKAVRIKRTGINCVLQEEGPSEAEPQPRVSAF